MKKVLLVGNAGYLKEKKLSDIIDSFDIVCRFNFGGSKVSFDRGKDIIGTKKDIWFNFIFSNLIKDGKITTNPYNIEYIHSYKKVYVNGIDWQLNPLMSISSSFEQYVNIENEIFNKLRVNKFTNLQDIYDTEIKNIWIFPFNYAEKIKLEVPMFGNNIPTTGFRAIYFFLNKYDKIYLCGFDGGKTKHWDKNYGHPVTDGGHNGIKEMKYIKKLEKENKIEFVS